VLVVEDDIEGKEVALIEGLKGIVREQSFTGDPKILGGSICRSCGAVADE
jgi:hypothetical protein